MIECRIFHDEEEIARLRFIKERSYNNNELADYRVEIAVERLGSEQAVGIHTVYVNDFPRMQKNVLALVKSALIRMLGMDLTLEPDTRAQDFSKKGNKMSPALTSWVRDLRK